MQNLESELSKKDDELRQFFLMQQQAAPANGNTSQEALSRRNSFQNGHNSDPSQLEDDDLGSDEAVQRIKPAAKSSAASTAVAEANNDNVDNHSSSSSPLNLSVDADDSQPDSSIGTIDSKVMQFKQA